MDKQFARAFVWFVFGGIYASLIWASVMFWGEPWVFVPMIVLIFMTIVVFMAILSYVID